MPQLDKYIFLNQVLALIFFFFLTYIYIRGTIIPTLNTSLKYRNKKLIELIRHDKAHWKLFNNTNDYFSDQGVNQLIIVNSYFTNIINIYKTTYDKKFFFNIYDYFFNIVNYYFLVSNPIFSYWKEFWIENNMISELYITIQNFLSGVDANTRYKLLPIKESFRIKTYENLKKKKNFEKKFLYGTIDVWHLFVWEFFFREIRKKAIEKK